MNECNLVFAGCTVIQGDGNDEIVFRFRLIRGERWSYYLHLPLYFRMALQTLKLFFSVVTGTE